MASKKTESKFTFIDLFAGIGGFHIALHNLGGECVFASEMDSEARKTYEHNFKKISPELFESGMFNSDIRNIMPNEIPDFDVLCAGFPCQPFSQAGHKRGFEDSHSSERGNLFFNIAEIIQEKKPRAFFLENVRGLVNHDNGKTFKVIKDILEVELGYSIYYKIVKASDYGLPQHRPRIFIIGFRDENFMKGFSFPAPKPLKFTMSDVWEGNCDRKVGFTLRIGGRGSDIDDRRNWDSYRVDGKVKRITYIQARKMQGFADDFEFPVSDSQAIKQLGNSVAIDAIQSVAENLLHYMNSLDMKNTELKKTKNKGEWTELLVFVKLLLEQKIHLSDSELNSKSEYFEISKVTTTNLEYDFLIIDKNTIQSKNKKTNATREIDISNLLTPKILSDLKNQIVESSSTFEVPSFEIVQNELGFTVVKGGNSNQKADILLDISNQQINKQNEGFGIKSYLGSKPTLLNASGNTNFIFKVEGFDKNKLDEVNAIDTANKLKDRLEFIYESGGKLIYEGAEKETMTYNLKMVDSFMPQIIGHVLLAFYKERISSLPKILDYIHREGKLQKDINYTDKDFLESKTKNLLFDILLGFFAGSKWDGNYESNGTIIMKNTGDCLAFHVIDMFSLKNYLFNHIKLDTPSTTRHRFGKLYIEKNGSLYFKLNLQLRF
jgi:DNA (cytosine-5)-methyltransferase 1